MRQSRFVTALVLCLLGVLMVGSTPSGAQAGNALVIGQDGYIFYREGTELAGQAVVDALLAQGHAVTHRQPLLGDPLDDMDSFDCVWDIRTDTTWSATENGYFLNFLVNGGNLFFAGEHAAFGARNNDLVSILFTLGGGVVTTSPVVPPGATGVDVVEAANPDHPLTRECNSVAEVDYDGVGNGTFTATGTGTWLTGAPDAAGAAAWGPGSMGVAPDSTVVGILDINWLYDGMNGTLLWRVDDPTVPTENLAFLENLATAMCGGPPCAGGCRPRNHGYWHRYCLGADAIDPGRHGHGNGPGPQGRHADLPAGLLTVADAALSGHGLTACEALDEGPFSDPRLAALRELATVQLNLAAGFLKRSCPVELRPVVDDDDLDVGDAIALMEMRLADGSLQALHEARWIGAHVVNGEALLDEE